MFQIICSRVSSSASTCSFISVIRYSVVTDARAPGPPSPAAPGSPRPCARRLAGLGVLKGFAKLLIGSMPTPIINTDFQQFTYVPVPPYSVLGILDAPVPVIVGSCASHVRPDFFCTPTSSSWSTTAPSRSRCPLCAPWSGTASKASMRWHFTAGYWFNARDVGGTLSVLNGLQFS